MRMSKKLEQLHHAINEEYESALLSAPHSGGIEVSKEVLKYFNNNLGKKYGCRLCKKDASEFYRIEICKLHAYLYEYDSLNKNKVSYYLLSTLELAMKVLQRKNFCDFGLDI